MGWGSPGTHAHNMTYTSLFCMQYRREFADPFWNSQEQNMLTYLFMLMTSWAIVCDVYYLKPTSIQVCRGLCRNFSCVPSPCGNIEGGEGTSDLGAEIIQARGGGGGQQVILWRLATCSHTNLEKNLFQRLANTPMCQGISPSPSLAGCSPCCCGRLINIFLMCAGGFLVA